MRLYGLIGARLSHSYSKNFFDQKFAAEGRFDCAYELFEMEEVSQLRSLVKAYPDLQGLNVTIPFKQSVMSLLDAVDPEAERVGAVNTIRIFRDEHSDALVGYNTDVDGFRQSLVGASLPARALVLGTGGAAKAVAFVLREWGVQVQMVSRHPQTGESIAYEEVGPQEIAAALWIVQCTPVGMSPHVDQKPPIPYEALTEKHLLYDLIYNPERTSFLREGVRRGCHVQNGMQMLHLQAEASWRIWNSPKRKIYLG